MVAIAVMAMMAMSTKGGAHGLHRPAIHGGARLCPPHCPRRRSLEKILKASATPHTYRL